MSLKKRIFAANYDRMTAATEAAGLSDMRRELLVQAHGRVLEIGGGTGANLRFYGDAVTSLTVTEPEEPMVRRLGLIYRKDKALSKAALGFIQVVLDHVGDETATGPKSRAPRVVA